MQRREILLDAAIDYVLEHGLIGLTLRPLAAALGTSDRMLLYHFGTRDNLIADVVGRTLRRGVEQITELDAQPDVRSAVRRLWQVYLTEPFRSCVDVYMQATATGLLGREPYLSEVRAGNELWNEALISFLLRSGTPERRVQRIATVVDAALTGFHLDLATDQPAVIEQGIEDLGDVAASLAAGPL